MKSFRMLAIWLCNFLIRAFTFFQLFENFFLRAKHRWSFLSLGRNAWSGAQGFSYCPSDKVKNRATPQSAGHCQAG
jgi:hypothetical protein